MLIDRIGHSGTVLAPRLAKPMMPDVPAVTALQRIAAPEVAPADVTLNPTWSPAANDRFGSLPEITSDRQNVFVAVDRSRHKPAKVNETSEVGRWPGLPLSPSLRGAYYAQPSALKTRCIIARRTGLAGYFSRRARLSVRAAGETGIGVRGPRPQGTPALAAKPLRPRWRARDASGSGGSRRDHRSSRARSSARHTANRRAHRPRTLAA